MCEIKEVKVDTGLRFLRRGQSDRNCAENIPDPAFEDLVDLVHRDGLTDISRCCPRARPRLSFDHEWTC